ncbi:hypothetical protein QJS65_13975 [Bacillus altitudinis]|uniref:hypothetical protein n=1 Tax=Bacillus altitudinis TaxID=293387 RepID=UPI0024A9D090|nr:hypothetical protein [Bacillus altitudinis]WHF25932.1 hypothetical protein QJS65_13975 [Bacillus altitudinis]
MTNANVRYIDAFKEDKEARLGYKKRQPNEDVRINKPYDEYNSNKDELYELFNEVIPVLKQISSNKLESKSSSSNSKGVVTLTEKDFNIMSLFNLYYSITSIIVTAIIVLTIVNVIPMIAGICWTIITLSFILGIYKGNKEWKQKHGATK